MPTLATLARGRSWPPGRLLGAGLVRRSENWRWCSLWRRGRPEEEEAPLARVAGGVAWDWTALVNAPQTERELEALRRSVNRGTPFGSEG